MDPDLFPDNGTATCGLTCSVQEGPHSIMRGGAANDIYVIPAPDKLTFATATLLAAACCIPGLLLLIIMWLNISEFSFNTHDDDEPVEPERSVQSGASEDDQSATDAADPNEKGKGVIDVQTNEGGDTRDALESNETSTPTTISQPKRSKNWTKRVSKKVFQKIGQAIQKQLHIPLFSAGVLAILAIGESNFFSSQVRKHTEPVPNIGMPMG